MFVLMPMFTEKTDGGPSWSGGWNVVHGAVLDTVGDYQEQAITPGWELMRVITAQQGEHSSHLGCPDRSHGIQWARRR
jgi:hypothetical protein